MKMPQTKSKRQAPIGIPEGISVRSKISFKPSTLRKEDRSVEFVLTTETPAFVWSWERWDVVSEVLIAKGVNIPANGQVPLQDSHNRGSIKSTLGSVREIKVENDEVIGRLYFAKSAEAVDAFEKIEDGHVDSGSVGYTATGTWIAKGKTFDYDGKTYEGPMQLTTKWDLHEYSVTAIGADPFAKARDMEAVKPTDSETEKEIDDIIVVEEIEKVNVSQETAVEVKNLQEDDNMPSTDDKKNETLVVDTKAIETKAIATEKARISGLTALCAKHDVSDLTANLIDTDVTLENARAIVLDKIAEKQVSIASASDTNIEMGKTDNEKFKSAAVNGLLTRSGIVTDSKDNSMSNVTFKSLARECVRRSGVANVYGMSDSEVLTLAMKSGTMGTSDFAHILDQSANMAISKGFQSAQQSWKLWATKGSLNNLEAANRVNLDDAPELLEVDEGGEIKQGIIGDRGEAIQLATFARKIRITRRALLADNMNLFARLFARFGARAANMIDATAYGVLTANGNMGDGLALFLDAASRGKNLATTAATVSGTSVDIGYQRMMAQTVGTNGVKLGIVPRFLMVGPKNRVAGHILTTSMQDTTATSNANGASNAFSDLTTITTPHLGQDWYMAASPTANDTVEVAFLEGKESPTLYQNENEGDVLGRSFVAYFDIGASAIGYQGLFKNAGE